MQLPWPSGQNGGRRPVQLVPVVGGKVDVTVMVLLTKLVPTKVVPVVVVVVVVQQNPTASGWRTVSVRLQASRILTVALNDPSERCRAQRTAACVSVAIKTAKAARTRRGSMAQARTDSASLARAAKPT